jgi:eukaryotic-like serine/threonine-protein kinase
VAPTLRLFKGEQEQTGSLRIGMRLDKYRLTARLGEGGFATVFAATDMIEDRKVAIKIPNDRFVANFQSSEDLHREVRILAHMDHPGIVPLKDARFVDGHFLMVFPLGQESLGDRLTRRISRATAVDYTYQMVAAVAYAHEKKVLHRDIKPDNFIVFPDQIVQLGDFGLARFEKGGHRASGSGTLGYISPEQAMGKPTFRSDVFSLGLVLYHLFSGEVPEYPFESLPAFNKFRRGLSNDLVNLIRKAIDPSPNQRFRDAVAMNNALIKIRYPLSDRNVNSDAA